jgi:hypothetical protein
LFVKEGNPHAVFAVLVSSDTKRIAHLSTKKGTWIEVHHCFLEEGNITIDEWDELRTERLKEGNKILFKLELIRTPLYPISCKWIFSVGELV